MSEVETPLLPSASVPREVPPPSVRRSVTTYGALTAFAVTINYIIGAGVLGLPNAYFQAGIVLTWILQIFFVSVSILCCWWVVESLARAHGLLASRAKATLPAAAEQPVNEIDSDQPNGRVTFATMCDVFGGSGMRTFCQVVLAIYCYGCLWAYVATFSSSLARLIFQYAAGGETCDVFGEHVDQACRWTYRGSVGLFGLIVVPLTLLEITEQQVLQLALTAYRFIAFAVMLVTVIVAWGIGGTLGTQTAGLWGFKWAGFALAFPTTIYASNVHYNLPDSLTPCRNKSRLLGVAAMAQLTSTFFYFLVGTLCAAYFAPPEPIITLNWARYTGLGGGWGVGETRWWATAVQLLVILFPVLDLLNVYPLVAFSLAGNIEPLFKPIAKRNPRAARIASKLTASLPALLLGVALGQVEVIFTITGLAAFWLQLIIPPALQWLSTRHFTKLWGPKSATTQYSARWRDNTPLIASVIVVGLVAWIYAVVMFFIQILRGDH